MDLLNSLMASGSEGPNNMATMGVSQVPQDATQLRVPQQALDIGSVPQVTGANVAASVPATMDASNTSNPMGGLMAAVAAGALGSMGGEKKQAPQGSGYRGGAQFTNPGAAAISGLRFSGGSPRGILNG